MEKRAKMKLLSCSLLIVSITRVTFHPGWLEPSPFSPVISSFIVTIPEWTLHHLVTLFPNCPGWLVAGLLASTPHFASYLFSVTCFLCSNTLAFPDDGQVPRWWAGSQMICLKIHSWVRSEASPFQRELWSVGTCGSVPAVLPTQHAADTACALTEKRAQHSFQQPLQTRPSFIWVFP